MESNTYIQVYDVKLEGSQKTNFNFPVKVEIDRIYGVLFSATDSENSKGAVCGLSIGNYAVINSNSDGLECSLFMNEGSNAKENYLPIAIKDAGGLNVSGFVKAHETVGAEKKQVMKVYLFGVKK